MKANPGGNLDPDHVFGRDHLIGQTWDRLETQSVLINAERRIGKTQILKKMLAQPRPGWHPIFRDLEKIHSAQEFAEHVFDDVQKFLGTTRRAKNILRRLLEESGRSGGDRDTVLRLLRLLDANHYVARDPDGKYRFRFPLIRRWWRVDRGLS